MFIRLRKAGNNVIRALAIQERINKPVLPRLHQITTKINPLKSKQFWLATPAATAEQNTRPMDCLLNTRSKTYDGAKSYNS